MRPLLTAVVLTALAGCPADEPGPAPDAATGDAAVGDAGGPDTAADAALPCTIHYDCPQGMYCYDGACHQDARFKVYHCGKTDSAGKDTCPPGRRCVSKQGSSSTCAESTSYACTSACDCGPAHCCKSGVCVKDTADPWLPGGTAVGAACKQGTDPTYCATDAACHAAKQAFGASDTFLAYDPAGKQATSICSGKSCFGTSCNCDPGDACVDTLQPKPAPGRACLLLSGGTCVENALAEAVFGFKPAELLPCCKAGCPAGQKCEVGWEADTTYAYRRVVGTCGSCGNGTCEAGEYPATCPKDCSCGDGRCAPQEVGVCAKDCGSCGDGTCGPGETSAGCAKDCSCGNGSCDPGEGPLETASTTACPQDCSCGDGICSPGESCAKDCVCQDAPFYPRQLRVCGDGVCSRAGCEDRESCLTCPGDCGACKWRAQGELLAVSGGTLYLPGVERIWGASASEIFAVGGGGKIWRRSGKAWTPMISPTTSGLVDVWGTSASDVWAVGSGGTVLHYDGTKWSVGSSPTTKNLWALWGSSSSDVWAVGAGGTILHHDGSAWSAVTSPATSDLLAVWGSSAGDVWAVGASAKLEAVILHHDGKGWSLAAAPPGPALYGVWGSSASDVIAVGMFGIMRYDGKAWTAQKLATKAMLLDVWGSSASDVHAVGFIGAGGVVMRYDGKAWSTTTITPAKNLHSVWGSSATDIYAVGDKSLLLHYDGSTWKTEAAATSNELDDVWGVSDSEVFAVGREILRWDGTSWKAMPPQLAGPLRGIWGGSKSDVVAVGSEQLWRYDGSFWTQVLSSSGAPPVSELHAVWGAAGSPGPGAVVYAVGDAVLRREGATWKAVDLGGVVSTVALRGVWASSASDVWATGLKGALLHYDGKAWSATTAGGGEDLHGIWGASAAAVHAVGAKGTALRYDGKAWSAQQTPVTVDLRAVGGSSASGEVLAVGEGGAVLRHDGKAWQHAAVDLRRYGWSNWGCGELRGLWLSPKRQAFVVGKLQGSRLILRLVPTS